MKSRFLYCLWVALGCAGLLPTAHGTEVWGGPMTSFTLASGSDPTLAINQDRLTANVWITRGAIQGIYNAAVETNFTRFLSPTNTEWSYGDLAYYKFLTYTNWEAWNGQHPPSMVGRDAVVHLISDDIYLALRFTEWGSGSSGGFAYLRSTPGPLTPAPPQLGRCSVAGQGLQFEFTNAPGFTFTVLGSTNVLLPTANWIVLGTVTDSPPGSGFYGFIEPGVITNSERKCYFLRWP